MYNRRNFIYLCTILECIEKIMIYTSSFKTTDEFVTANEQMNYNASWALLLVIGEESKKLSKDLKSDYSTIPWKQLAGTRDFLAHEYRTLNQQLVFDIVKQELPMLKSVIISMFPKVNYNEDVLNAALSSEYYKHIQYLRKTLND